MAKRKRRGTSAPTNKAVAITRVSTTMQADDGTSLQAQRAAVERYAHGMGLELVAVIEDAGVSGSIPLAQRPGGRRVLDMIERGEVGAVIAPKLDRLFRDAEDALKVTREWDELGVALHLLDLRVDTASPVGRVFLTLLAAFAEWERSMISERISIAMQHLLARGVRLGAEPLGHRRALERDDDGRRVFVEDEHERETVLRIRELRARGMSLRAIAAALEADGHRPKRGGSRWSASVVRAVCAREPSRVAA